MIKKLRLHTEIEDFEIRDNCLCLGGRKISEIMSDIGNTPAYLYDRELIAKRIHHLRTSLPAGVNLHYAMKANPMPDVVNFIAPQVDGIDIASVGELEIALATKCDPTNISFAGPGKSVAELEAAVRAGITINAESTIELDRLATIAETDGLRPSVAIRVNPDFELKNSGMKMSGGPKQFGIDAEQVPNVLRRMTNLPIEFAGFHIFSGSQNLRPEAICESQQKAFALAVALMDHAPGAARFINIGGGFGVPYFPGDQPLELESISENLSKILLDRDAICPDTEIVLELGRYFVAEAGVYVCIILDRKISRGHVFLITNGGLHHHLAASGNFGQVIRKNYPVLIANKIQSDDIENVSIVGPLCTPLDLLADKMDMSKAEIGDLVAVFQSGAYGYTASPHLFLAHPPPKEVLV